MNTHIVVGVVLLLSTTAFADDVLHFDTAPGTRQGRVTQRSCDGSCTFSVRVCTEEALDEIRLLPAHVELIPPVPGSSGCGEATVVTLRPGRSQSARLTLRARATSGVPRRLARDRLTLRCLPERAESHTCPTFVPSTTTTTTSTLPPDQCPPPDVRCCRGDQLRALFGPACLELRRDTETDPQGTICEFTHSEITEASCEGSGCGPSSGCCLVNGCPAYAVYGATNTNLLSFICEADGGTFVRGECDAEPIHPLRPCRPTGCSDHICASRGITTTCDWDPAWACLRDAVCERQGHGGCGWTVLPGSPPCAAAEGY